MSPAAVFPPHSYPRKPPAFLNIGDLATFPSRTRPPCRGRHSLGPAIRLRHHCPYRDQAGNTLRQPCVRRLRISVWNVSIRLAAIMANRQTLDDHPEPNPRDFRAVYEFAARTGWRVAL
jgi:hypothetical protein